MYWLYCLLAVCAGTFIPLQAGVNASLRSHLDSPHYATLVSVVVSTLCMVLLCAVLRLPVPDFRVAMQAPWWVWTGGIVGVVYVFAALALAPKLGAMALVAAIVGGQMICSMVLDHFALAGFSHHSVSAGRIAGAILLLSGVFLIHKY